MIGRIIIIALIGGGISIYFLIQYILMYHFVNSLEFVEIASDPITGAQKMSEMLLFRNFFIGALVLTIVFIFCFVFCMRVKEKVEKRIIENKEIKRKRKEEKELRKKNKKGISEIRYCIYCGAKMEKQGKYCTNCGKEQ